MHLYKSQNALNMICKSPMKFQNYSMVVYKIRSSNKLRSRNKSMRSSFKCCGIEKIIFFTKKYTYMSFSCK